MYVVEPQAYTHILHNNKTNITHKLTWICKVRVEIIECWERVIIKKTYIDLVKESTASILKTFIPK